MAAYMSTPVAKAWWVLPATDTVASALCIGFSRLSCARRFMCCPSKWRDSRPSLDSTYSRRAAVTSIWCPWVSIRIGRLLMSTGWFQVAPGQVNRTRGAGKLPPSTPVTTVGAGSSTQPDALVGRGDVQRFPVLGDGAPGHHDAGGLERFGQAGVGEWLAGVLGLHQPQDHLLDGGAGCLAAGVGADAGGEEIAQRQRAPRGVDVLARDGARDGGLMHADLGRHLAQGEGPQGLRAELQEPGLLADQAVGDLEQGLASLLQVAQQPARFLQAPAQVARVGGAGVLDHC